MKLAPRTTLIVAVLIAVVTGFFTLRYVSSVSRSAAAQAEPQLRILVAKQDIPARVTIDASMLRRVSRPVSQVEPGAVLEARKAVGQLSLVSLPAGSTITASRIGSPQSVALSVVLKPGMRAVSIGIDRVKAVAGLIQPGDRVDVIAVPPRAGDETPQGRTILFGALVLASGTQMESTSQPSPQPGQQDSNLTTVTLAVTPAQADVLAAADINATLRLALRSPRDPVGNAPAARFILPVAAAPTNRPNATFTQPAPQFVPVAQPVAAAPARPAPVARPQRAPRSGVEIIEEQAAAPSSGS